MQSENESTEQAIKSRGLRKVREGLVVSNKMDKTVVVAITVQKRHPQYKKYIKRTVKYLAHDERNDCKMGDRVRIIEGRPLSSRKRWRVQQIVERAL